MAPDKPCHLFALIHYGLHPAQFGDVLHEQVKRMSSTARVRDVRQLLQHCLTGCHVGCSAVGDDLQVSMHSVIGLTTTAICVVVCQHVQARTKTYLHHIVCSKQLSVVHEHALNVR